MAVNLATEEYRRL